MVRVSVHKNCLLFLSSDKYSCSLNSSCVAYRGAREPLLLLDLTIVEENTDNVAGLKMVVSGRFRNST